MATIYSLKPAVQSLLRPTVARLAAVGVTANQVTIAAMVMSVAYGAVIAITNGTSAALFALPLVLLLRMALNAVDGMLAREHGQVSRLGFFLNEIGDVVSDTALYLPLALVLAPGAPLLASAVVVGFVLTEFAGVLGAGAGGARRYDGPFGKSDRAAYLSLLAVVVALFKPAAWLPVAAFSVALFLALVTTGNRVRTALREPRSG